MDTCVGSIADYTHTLRFDDLSGDAVRHCKRTLIDTFGCALGGFNAEPSRIARHMAQRTSLVSGARVIGTTHRTLPELAAFANGVMARYLDGNDAFLGGGGHPSDLIAAVIAAADISGADGRTVITAVTLAYEIYYNLWKVAGVRDKGIDHVFYTVVAGAAGAAKVLGLDQRRVAEALSLAITPNIALDATRYGILGMWKGCAGGNAARNCVFAALLAAAGMTGPEKPLQGRHGLENLVGKEIKLLPFGGDGRPFRIGETTMKCFHSEGHALTPITVALPLSRQVEAGDIEAVTIYTYWFAWEVIGSEREKWRPTTREAADHSLPYIVAAVLVERAFNEETFSEQRLRDPRIRRLIDKIEVKEDVEFTRQFPRCMPCRIEIKTRSGERKVGQSDYPLGHYNNPMSDDEVNAKFRDHSQYTLPQEQIGRALDALWQIDTAVDLSAIFEALQTGG